MKDLFDQLKDRSISLERRKDLAMFLKEFCSFSSSLQQSGQPSRESFYKVRFLKCFSEYYFLLFTFFVSNTFFIKYFFQRDLRIEFVVTFFVIP